MLPPTGVYPWLKTSNIPIPETPVKKGRPQPSHSRRSTQLLQAERSAGRTRFSRLSSLVREQPGQRLAHRAHERRELLRLDELRRDERERRGERSVLGLVADLAVLGLPRHERPTRLGHPEKVAAERVTDRPAVMLLERVGGRLLGFVERSLGVRADMPVPTRGRAFDPGGAHDAHVVDEARE